MKNLVCVVSSSLVLLAGCGDVGCPAGLVEQGGRCVEARDAAADANHTSMPDAAMPRLVDAYVPDATPACSTDLTSDRNHCGSCERVCALTEACVASSCRASLSLLQGATADDSIRVVRSSPSGAQTCVGGVHRGSATWDLDGMPSNADGGDSAFVSCIAASSAFITRFNLNPLVPPNPGAPNEAIRGLALGESDLYVVGGARGDLFVDGTVRWTATGLDGFVAHLRGSSLVDVQQIGGAGDALVQTVATSASGTCFGGWFAGNATLPGLGEVVAIGATDAFITCTPVGGVARSMVFSGPGADETASIAISDDDVFIAGRHEGAMFGALPLSTAGGLDAFLVRATMSTGLVEAAQSLGGSGFDFATGIAIEGANVILSGACSGTFADTSCRSDGDGFVASFAARGTTHTWTRVLSSASFDLIYDVSARAGRIVIGGSISASTTFGGLRLSAVGRDDAFFGVLTPAGVVAEGTIWGGILDDRVLSVSALPGGGVAVAGEFQGRATVAETTVTSSAGYDGFFARPAHP